MSTASLPEKPRKLLRWTDSSELEELSRDQHRPNIDDTKESIGPEISGLSKREDWYGAKMRRLRDVVETLRKDLRDKERDYIRLKNKYNVSKRKLVQLQEDLQKYTDEKLDSDSELEFVRLQLIEKNKELLNVLENSENSGHFSQNDNHDVVGKCGRVEDSGIDHTDENVNCIAEDSILSEKFLSLHKETRKLVVYILLSFAICLSVVSLVTGSTVLSAIVVGFWTVGLACLWLERKQLFKAFKTKYLKKIREVSLENSRLRADASKLDTRIAEVNQQLTNEKQEHNDVISRLNVVTDKLSEEKAKNEELVKLEKSTFEELQGERVRRRRAEEQLEEVSVQVLTAREKDEDAQCGDVCRELRNNLKLERESKERLSRENERLIKEIVEMNMKQEKERLERELEFENGMPGSKQEQTGVEEIKQEVVSKDECKLQYTNNNNSNNNIEEQDGQTRINEEKHAFNEEKNDKTTNFDEENKNFDSKECEKMEKHGDCEETANQAHLISNVSETGKVSEAESKNAKQSYSNPNNCWLCACSIPNETSLALLIIIIACLVLALKVTLTSNVFLCVLFMVVVGCFTYYQVARNIDHSS